MLKIKRLHPAVAMPKYQTAGAGAFDLAALTGGVIAPGESATIQTGIAMEIPEGYVGLIHPRSGLGVKFDIDSHAGVIDSDYRGEVQAHLRNLSDIPFVYNAGDRICQMVVLQCPQVELVEVSELSETARGEGGFGSTGRS